MPFVSPHLNDQFLECYPVGHRIEGREVAVEVEGRYPAANQRHHVPAYNFHIRPLPSNEIVGNVSFRLGSNVHIDNYAGNIGFNVKESHRGHGFAAKALALIGEVIRAHGFERVFITCDPDNHASRRTCENVGARLLGEVTIPEDNDLYARGMRKKLRFEWRPGERHAGRVPPEAARGAPPDESSVGSVTMKPYLDQVLAELPAGLSAAETRIWLFNYVRDIPYAYSDNTPEEVVVQRIGDCRGKSRLLAELLQTQGIPSRFLIAQYRLPPFPDEVRFIPEQLDYHHAAEFCIEGRWVLVDPTYDRALKTLCFVVNEWDGLTDTGMSVRPLAVKREGDSDPGFDRIRGELEERLRAAFQQHGHELMAYRSKFNGLLAQERDPTRRRRT